MSNKAAAEAKAKGNDFFTKKKYPEAIEWYSKAIKADPKDPTFYSNRCAAYMAIDKFEEALKDAESCIRLQPSWVKGWYRKGAALVSLSRYEEAAMAFRKGLEIEPQNDDLKNRLADAERQAKYAPKRFMDDGVRSLKGSRMCKESSQPRNFLGFLGRLRFRPLNLPRKRAMLFSAMPSMKKPLRSTERRSLSPPQRRKRPHTTPTGPHVTHSYTITTRWSLMQQLPSTLSLVPKLTSAAAWLMKAWKSTSWALTT